MRILWRRQAGGKKEKGNEGRREKLRREGEKKERVGTREGSIWRKVRISNG